MCMCVRMYSTVQIILGSSSVARRKILGEMGYDFTTMVILTISLEFLVLDWLLLLQSLNSLLLLLDCRH